MEAPHLLLEHLTLKSSGKHSLLLVLDQSSTLQLMKLALVDWLCLTSVETVPAPPLSVSTNWIANGDFSSFSGVKTTSQLNSGWTTSSDASLIAPWTFTSASNNYEMDPVGMYSAFGRNALVTIKQSIATTVGKTYSVAFSLNQNPNCGGSKIGLDSARSTSPQSFSISDTVTHVIS